MTGEPPKPSSFFAELKRRRVIRVGIAYAAAVFVILQVADLIFPALDISDAVYRFLVIASLLGFPVALVLAWAFDITPAGVRLTAAEGEDGAIVAPIRPWIVYGVAIAGVLGIVAAAAFWARPGPAAGAVAAGADVIAVLPFEIAGPGLDDMGEGLVDLLSRNLDEVGAIRTVEPRTVLSNWRRRAESGVMGLDGKLSVGRDVAAGSILTGSLVAVGAEVRLSADLYSVDGASLGSAHVDGNADELLDLVDSFSLALLREIWRSRAPLPRFNVSAITTGDPQAVRAYLEGKKQYRASRWEDAQRAFQRAIGADSAFAAAHFMLVRTLSWLSGPERDRMVERELEIAQRLADRLPARERTLLQAEVLSRAGDIVSAMDTLRSFLQRYPDDPEAMFALADDEFHAGQIFQPTAQRIRRFGAVLDRDPSFVPALIHPLELSFAVGDTSLIRQYVTRLEVAAPADTLALRTYRTAARAFYEPDRVDSLIAALDLVLRADSANDLGWQARLALASPLTRLAILRPAAQQQMVIDWAMSRLSRADDFRTEEFTIALLIASGRLEQAFGLLSRDSGRPASAPGLPTRYVRLPVQLGYVAPSAYDGERFPRLSDEAALEARMLAAIDAGDSDAVQRLVPLAQEREREQGAPFWGVIATVGGGFLRAWSGEPVEGLADVEIALQQVNTQSQPFWFRWLDWMSTYPETRQRALTLLSRPWMRDPEYDVPRLYVLGRARRADGDTAAAMDAYALFVDALAAADPGSRIGARLDSARAALDTAGSR